MDLSWIALTELNDENVKMAKLQTLIVKKEQEPERIAFNVYLFLNYMLNKS